jgi:hypothetical protein
MKSPVFTGLVFFQLVITLVYELIQLCMQNIIYVETCHIFVGIKKMINEETRSEVF